MSEVICEQFYKYLSFSLTLKNKDRNLNERSIAKLFFRFKLKLRKAKLICKITNIDHFFEAS